MTFEFQKNGIKIGILRDKMLISIFKTSLEYITKNTLDGKNVICQLLDVENEIYQNINIKILDKGSIIFEDIVQLENLFQNVPDSINIFRINDSSFKDFIEKPLIQGEFYINTKPANDKKFNIKQIQEERLETLSLSNIRANEVFFDQKLKIILKRNVYDKMVVSKKYSTSYEEGGFLLGNVFSELENINNYIVEITDFIEAKHTGASVIQLIFTGETFSEIKNLIRSESYKGKKMIGWVHTHLFPARQNKSGLSYADLNLHHTTFKFSWQIAGLINIEYDNSNVLRFFATHPNHHLKMKEFQYIIVD